MGNYTGGHITKWPAIQTLPRTNYWAELAEILHGILLGDSTWDSRGVFWNSFWGPRNGVPLGVPGGSKIFKKFCFIFSIFWRKWVPGCLNRIKKWTLTLILGFSSDLGFFKRQGFIAFLIFFNRNGSLKCTNHSKISNEGSITILICDLDVQRLISFGKN